MSRQTLELAPKHSTDRQRHCVSLNRAAAHIRYSEISQPEFSMAEQEHKPIQQPGAQPEQQAAQGSQAETGAGPTASSPSGQAASQGQPETSQAAADQQGQETTDTQGAADAATAGAAAGTAAAAPWYARAPIWLAIVLLLALLAALAWLLYQKYTAEERLTAEQYQTLGELKAYNDAQEAYLRSLRALLQEDPCDIPALLAQIDPPAGSGLPALDGRDGATPAEQGSGMSGRSGEPLQIPEDAAQQPESTPDSSGQGKRGAPAETTPAVPDKAEPAIPVAPATAEAAQSAQKRAATEAQPNLKAREPASVAELLEQNTVLIIALMGRGISMGTGFFIAPDTIMTNAHVVGQADEVVYINKFVGTLRSAAVLMRTQAQGLDFAVLKTRERIPVKPLKLCTDLVTRMEKVSAWGFPSAVVSDDPKFIGLLRGNQQAAPEVVYTEGSVNVVLERKPPLVVHSATVSQGNSGGPLLDAHGRMVALVTAIYSTSGGGQGLSFAIPVDTVIAVARELIRTGTVSRGTLDLTSVELNPGIVEYAGLEVDSGLMVSQVLPGGESEKAGIRGGSVRAQYGSSVIFLGGDVITAIDGIPIEGYDDYYAFMADSRAGDKVDVTLLRAGREVTLRDVVLVQQTEENMRWHIR